MRSFLCGFQRTGTLLQQKMPLYKLVAFYILRELLFAIYQTLARCRKSCGAHYNTLHKNHVLAGVTLYVTSQTQYCLLVRKHVLQLMEGRMRREEMAYAIILIIDWYKLHFKLNNCGNRATLLQNKHFSYYPTPQTNSIFNNLLALQAHY